MATIQSHTMQARANQLLDSWLQQSQSPEGTKGVTVSKREAQALVKQAEHLEVKELEQLKKALLQTLQKDSFQIAPDARQLFLDFFKFPPDAVPVTSTQRRDVNNAQQVKAAHETDARVKVPTKEVKQMIQQAASLPENLRALVGQSILGSVQAGNVKLDQEGRSALTKFIAQSGAQAGAGLGSMAEGLAMAGQQLGMAGMFPNPGRAMAAEVVNTFQRRGGLDALDTAISMGAAPMSYAQYVAMHGGSFEDILFAFLMQLADKTDKNLVEKMKQFDKQEKMGGKTNVASAMDQVFGGDAKDTSVVPGAPQAGGKLQRVSTQLEAVVQSAHYATAAQSAGGTQITKAEADRLVTKLGSLPANVQTLLAGSVCSAMKAKGLPLQPEAFEALKTWGTSVAGKKFDVGALAVAQKTGAAQPDTALAQALRNSDKLEDKLASFLVDTLVKPDESLKEKFKPFKAMRDEIDRFADGTSAVSPEATPEAKAGKGKKKADKAEATAPAAAPEAAAAPAAPMAGPPATEPQSDAISQNEIQRLVQERNRIFDMLSNIMKALHDMQMSSIRNLR